jgi:hypothetical protein
MKQYARNHLRWWRAALVAACWGFFAAGVLAQPVGPGGHAGGMATRSVSKYLGLERQLQQALEERNGDAAAAMLDPGFTHRPSTLQDAVSQQEWLKQAQAKTPGPSRVRDLSVREVDDLAIVSFLLEPQHSGKHREPTYFIVDVWRQSTDKLLTRHSDEIAHPPPLQEKPTGRE